MNSVSDFYAGKRVLVTGAGGFIGGALARGLVSRGAKVIGLHRSTSPIWADATHDVRYGDVTSYDEMRELLATEEIQHVFHLAGSAIVRIAGRDPVSAFRNNVMGTVALLEAARNVGKSTIASIVVASSDKAYGDHDELPYTEEHALQPKNTYDASKACGDIAARTYGSNYEMPVCVTRASNVYGPGDMAMSRLIPNTIRRAWENSWPRLYEDVDKMEREFVFIDDVVEAYLLLGVACSLGRFKGEAFNIGGTGPSRIRDVVRMIWDEMKPTEPFDVTLIPREGTFKEIGRQYIDAGKLRAVTGWEPTIDLKTGIARSVAWYRSIFEATS